MSASRLNHFLCVAAVWKTDRVQQHISITCKVASRSPFNAKRLFLVTINAHTKVIRLILGCKKGTKRNRSSHFSEPCLQIETERIINVRDTIRRRAKTDVGATPLFPCLPDKGCTNRLLTASISSSTDIPLFPNTSSGHTSLQVSLNAKKKKVCNTNA